MDLYLITINMMKMPGFDRTGPRGEGPRTGRNMGKCGPAPERKSSRTSNDERETGDHPPGWGFFRGLGRGPGRGAGKGRGRGHGRGGRMRMRGGW